MSLRAAGRILVVLAACAAVAAASTTDAVMRVRNMMMIPREVDARRFVVELHTGREQRACAAEVVAAHRAQAADEPDVGLRARRVRRATVSEPGGTAAGRSSGAWWLRV
jgi:hypothetical protein